ncbi:MAG: hypothetical protein DMG22_23090 [Acidobacteria bacterium]|nr:MAG: hypothetical protein DMG22_23090 [Acidobacteriota bacterium]
MNGTSQLSSNSYLDNREFSDMENWSDTYATSQLGFRISTSSRCANHTPPALTFQVRIDIVGLGLHRGS